MSLIPVHVDFVGQDAILQGTDWTRLIPFSASMVVYDPVVTAGALLRMAIKDPTLTTTYLSTAAGTIVLTWSDSTHLLVRVTAAGSSLVSNVSAPLPFTFQGAVWQVEAKSGITGFFDQIAEGTADMKAEVTTATT